MLVFSDDKISVYRNKDGRMRVYMRDTKCVISYPKYLMEKFLGRSLDSNEQVHHKDGNPLNNDISNLEVVFLGEHQRVHSTKYHDMMTTCSCCGREFLWTASKQSNYYGNLNKRDRKRSGYVFCSKSCSGKFGKMIQDGVPFIPFTDR